MHLHTVWRSWDHVWHWEPPSLNAAVGISLFICPFSLTCHFVPQEMRKCKNDALLFSHYSHKGPTAVYECPALCFCLYLSLCFHTCKYAQWKTVLEMQEAFVENKFDQCLFPTMWQVTNTYCILYSTSSIKQCRVHYSNYSISFTGTSTVDAPHNLRLIINI